MNISNHKHEDISKIRNIQLNHRNRLEIYIDKFYNIITGKTREKVLVIPNNIVRKTGFIIVSKPQVITHRMMNNKRIKMTRENLVIDPRTLPYGFEQN